MKTYVNDAKFLFSNVNDATGGRSLGISLGEFVGYRMKRNPLVVIYIHVEKRITPKR